MRSQILRDVIAGCAGALAVAALIGLPWKPAAGQQPQAQPRHYELLPYFRPLKPAVPVPPAPHARITTGP
jgi:hypothetical protein